MGLQNYWHLTGKLGLLHWKVEYLIQMHNTWLKKFNHLVHQDVLKKMAIGVTDSHLQKTSKVLYWAVHCFFLPLNLLFQYHLY